MWWYLPSLAGPAQFLLCCNVKINGEIFYTKFNNIHSLWTNIWIILDRCLQAVRDVVVINTESMWNKCIVDC